MPAIDMLYDHLITALAKLGAVEYIEVAQDTVISMGADDDLPAADNRRTVGIPGGSGDPETLSGFTVDAMDPLVL